MKIKLKSRVNVEKEYDVEFPIYRLHDCGGDMYNSKHYARIDRTPDGKFTKLEIEIGSFFRNREVQVNVSYDPDYRMDGSEAGYHLGLGEYTCTIEEWYSAVKQAREMLERLP